MNYERTLGTLCALSGPSGFEERVSEAAAELLTHPERRSDMARALSRLAIPDANEKIYTTLQNLLR